MLLVQALPAARDVGLGQPGRVRGLARRRRAAELDEEAVGDRPQGKIRLVHPRTIADNGGPVHNCRARAARPGYGVYWW